MKVPLLSAACRGAPGRRTTGGIVEPLPIGGEALLKLKTFLLHRSPNGKTAETSLKKKEAPRQRKGKAEGPYMATGPTGNN